MLVFPAVGHVVMEDDPVRTAEALSNFVERNCGAQATHEIVLPGGRVITVRGAAPQRTAGAGASPFGATPGVGMERGSNPPPFAAGAGRVGMGTPPAGQKE